MAPLVLGRPAKLDQLTAKLDAVAAARARWWWKGLPGGRGSPFGRVVRLRARSGLYGRPFGRPGRPVQR
jgi:hypothetical protein